jgi:hypothetical protein
MTDMCLVSQGCAQIVIQEAEGVEIRLNPGQVAAPHEPGRGRAGELVGVKSPGVIGRE